MPLPKRPQKPQGSRLPSRPAANSLPSFETSEPENAYADPFGDTEDFAEEAYPAQAEEVYEEAEQEDDEDFYEVDDDGRFGVEDPNESLSEDSEFNEGFIIGYDEIDENTPTVTGQEALINAVSELPEELVPAAEAFFALMDDDEVSEIAMNSPERVNYKKRGRRLRAQSITFGSTASYHEFINRIIIPMADTSETIDGENHLIEGRMTFPATEEGEAPVTARLTIVGPPVIKDAKVQIAKKSRIQYSLDDMLEFGSMSSNMRNFLKALAHGKATVVFSGVSGAGKTTLIEAMANHFDPDDRVIVVEDTPELRIPTGDVVSFVAPAPRPGRDDLVTMEWLIKATNRMRPDRIIVGECRGGEFSEFLIAANSGADGSMTTIHADSPRKTLDKMVSLSLKNGTSKSENAVIRDISSTVQIIVQAELIDDKHVVSSIEEISNMTTNGGAVISSQTIFGYDRQTQTFQARNHPSDHLRSFLEQRGVELRPEWFRS